MQTLLIAEDETDERTAPTTDAIPGPIVMKPFGTSELLEDAERERADASTSMAKPAG